MEEGHPHETPRPVEPLPTVQQVPPPLHPAPGPSGQEVYEIFADKVGFVPNARKEDNRYQAKFVGLSILAGLVIGPIAGGVMDGANGALVGVFLGLFAGLLGGLIVSGAILAVRGLKR